MKYVFGLLVFLVIVCDGVHAGETPVHHGALFRTQWESFPAPASSPKKEKTAKPAKASAAGSASATNSSDDIRARVVAAAERLLQSSPAPVQDDSQFGAADVRKILKDAGLSGCVKEDENVPQLVKRATSNDSYGTQDHPQLGDFVLFHNQFDRNRNGESDDWFTGIGVVIERERKKVWVVTRTGNTPKKLVLSPRGPMVHRHRDEVVNSFVKVPTPHDPPDAQYLAGQLYAGFVDVEQYTAACAQ